MQLRCTYCQTMFAVSRDDMLAALEHMEENKQAYYDAHCPKCRRANRVERRKLELAYPTWKADIKAMTKAAMAEEEKTADKAKVPAAKKK
jgi:phage FluMu protein Com